MNVDLSLRELRMIRYWRESCHQYNEYCPLALCMGEEGADFCHKTIDKIGGAVEKELKRKANEALKEKLEERKKKPIA